MPGKFEIYRNGAGEYRFRLKAGNSETILVSKGHRAMGTVLRGVDAVQEHCGDASLFVPKTTKTGMFRFELQAKSRQVIGSSQNYRSRSGRDKGMRAVARATIGAKVVDLTGQA